MNNIDVITYEIGDVVIRKNKAPDVYGNEAAEEVVINTRIVESNSYYYQLLYFKSEPDSGHVALEYEPVDPKSKEAYYTYLRNIQEQRLKKKDKSKSVVNVLLKDKESKNTIKVNPNNAKTTFKPKL